MKMPLQRLVSRSFRVRRIELKWATYAKNNNTNDGKFQLSLKVDVHVDYYDKVMRVRNGSG